MLMRVLAALTLFAVSQGISAQVNALPPSRHILVYGQAQARALPDRFRITLGFEAVDPDPDAARQRVEANMRTVISHLRSVGVPHDEIVATSLRIEPRQRHDASLREMVFAGTAVTRTLTARFTRAADLEAFLARVRTSKELTISNVTTELSTEPALRERLRQKAIEASRAKAEVIAKQYGVRLAGLYSVSDVAPQFQYGIREGSWPQLYEWRDRNGGTLDLITVTGTRAPAPPAPPPVGESIQQGFVTFGDTIYAVFLIAD